MIRTDSRWLISENLNFFRTAAKPQKPLVPPIVNPRGRWSTSVSVRPIGRSSSPSEFNRITSDVHKPRVSSVSLDRNERSVSVDRSARVSDSQHNNKSTSVANLGKNSDISKELKLKHVKTQNARVSIVPLKNSRERYSGSSSIRKVSETVKLFEKFRSKSCVRFRPDDLKEKGTGEEIKVKVFCKEIKVKDFRPGPIYALLVRPSFLEVNGTSIGIDDGSCTMII